MERRSTSQRGREFCSARGTASTSYFLKIRRLTIVGAIHPRALTQEIKEQLRAVRGPILFAGRMHTLLEMSRRPQSASLPEQPLHAGFYLGLGLALMCDFASAVNDGRMSSSATEAVLAKMETFIGRN